MTINTRNDNMRKTKILFITTSYPEDCYEQLKLDSNGVLQAANNNFQWAVIEGLDSNMYDYSIVCTPALPAWPRYKRLLTPKGVFRVNTIPKGHYLSYCNLPAIKQISIRSVLRRYIRQWCQSNDHFDRLIVLVYTQQTEHLGSALDLKRRYPNLVVAPIITDLIDNALDYDANRKILKRIQIKVEQYSEKRLLKKVDKFILLTQAMEECIKEAKGKSIVIEGIARDSMCPTLINNRSGDIKSLLYSGTFQEFGGLRILVDAFLLTKDPSFRLILCGDGALTDYVKEVSEKDCRIIYKGRIDREEVLRLQREATVLINPRQPNGGITKYSFPSKTMEYMSSHTPMIGYKLEGIPNEYFNYMFPVENLSVESLKSVIEKTLSLPSSELNDKALSAAEFIKNNKCPKRQVQKIINFLSQ